MVKLVSSFSFHWEIVQMKRGFYLIVDKFTEQSLVFYTSTLNIAAHSVAL